MNVFSFSKGYIALSTVLIVSVIAGMISVTVTLLSVSSAQGSLAASKGEDTLGFVEGCAEDGLLKSWASTDYSGGNITRPEGICTVAVAKNGTTWTITVSTLDAKYKKTVLVTFDRSPTKVTLLSQKEI